MVNVLKKLDHLRTSTVEKVFRAVDRGDYVNTDDRYLAYLQRPWASAHLHLSAPCIYGYVLMSICQPLCPFYMVCASLCLMLPFLSTSSSLVIPLFTSVPLYILSCSLSNISLLLHFSSTLQLPYVTLLSPYSSYCSACHVICNFFYTYYM